MLLAKLKTWWRVASSTVLLMNSISILPTATSSFNVLPTDLRSSLAQQTQSGIRRTLSVTMTKLLLVKQGNTWLPKERHVLKCLPRSHPLTHRSLLIPQTNATSGAQKRVASSPILETAADTSTVSITFPSQSNASSVNTLMPGLRSAPSHSSPGAELSLMLSAKDSTSLRF